MHPTIQEAFLDELEKIAKARWQEALESGKLTPQDVAPRMGTPAALAAAPGPVGAGYRHIARQQTFGTDLTPEQLSLHRTMNSGLAKANLEDLGGIPHHFPGMGPATMMGDVHAGPDSGEFLREIGEGKRVVPTIRTYTHLVPKINKSIQDSGSSQVVKDIGNRAASLVPEMMPSMQPVDRTLSRAIVAHEGGEKALIEGMKHVGDESGIGVPGRAISSHIGGLPMLEEAHASFRDPEAQKVLHGIRQMDPDDAFVQAKMKQFGHTPENPLPIGGKAHGKLEAAIAARAPENSMAVQNRVGAAMNDMGHSLHIDKTHPRLTNAIEAATQTLRNSPVTPFELRESVEKAYPKMMSVMKSSPSMDPSNLGERILHLRRAIRK